MSLERVYHRLPIVLQNVACSVEGWRIQRTRYGSRFRERLREAEERMTWPEQRVLEYRDNRLQELVQHAATTVPYYREMFERESVDPKRIRTLDDLKQLPILTKDEVRRHSQEMLSETVPLKQRVMVHTSGTTGGGLRFATTQDAIQQQWAIWWRYRRWHGIEQGTWCGYFGGRSVVPLSQSSVPFWRYNQFGRQILFSGYHMSPRNLPAYVGELRRCQPPWLHGYPSLLALLASHLLDSGEDLGYQVQAITIGAENLLPQQAEIIEKAFGRRPRQHYGMAEAVANISECGDGALRVDEDFAAVEFVPSNDGKHYRVVGTNFTNLATPLIRYDVQDLVTLGPTNSMGDRPGRIVQEIDGRREDYVVLPGGAKIGRMDHVFKDLVSIREAQIHQTRVGEIAIRVVRNHEYGKDDERRLLAETRQRIGDGTEIHIEYVDKLERSKTGKLRFVISELSDGTLAPECDSEVEPRS